MSEKYSLLAFKPGVALQSSELNEIQDNFYIQQTFNITALNNWFKIPPSDISITGYIDDKYSPSMWHGIVPLFPLQLRTDLISTTTIQVVLTTGWYRVAITGIQKWIYIGSERLLSLSTSNILVNTDYVVGVTVKSRIIEASQNPTDEGYELNDNSLGLISSWTDGASRITMYLDLIQAFTPETIPENYQILCKMRKFETSPGSFTIKIQYPNNYLIKNINT